ncbi:glycosyltransferase [Mobilicoccus massiliensis]|uniref:glycosyltransferase n=1 Tax=Mobilicoccus massiliensis TaxID=1522310 RepID=UPI0006938DD8|nr:glycosyltransferase [Mobilicoccus massiliensis]
MTDVNPLTLAAQPVPGERYDDLVVVTPWYPTAENPMWGNFVRDAVTTLRRHHTDPVTVIHVDSTPVAEDAPAEEGRPVGEDGVPAATWSTVTERPEARVVHVRAPMDPMTPRHEAIDVQRAALIAHALPHITQATCVNAHVGAPTGAAVAPLLARPTRFVITEHATYVRAVFADLDAGSDYRAAVARAQAVIAVGDEAAGVLRRYCGQQAEIIRAVPNPVRFDDVPLRDAPMREPLRWLYVGSLIERKGVDKLVESFAIAVARDPDRPWHLTLVGDGPMREQLTERIAELGLADKVTFAGIVAPAEVGSYLRTHDVLVHLSAYETFGITLIEAAASGLPVVVTKCGGPEETMALPEDVGMCVFVPRDPEPAAVADAVASLRRDMSLDELRHVRGVLRGFYGEERVADLLHTHVLGSPAEHPFTEQGDLRIVVVYQGLVQWRRLMHGIQRAIDMGAQVVAVDLESMTAGVIPPGMSLVTVGQPDRYNALHRVERAVVDRAPRAVLRGAGKVVEKLPDNRRGEARKLLARAETFHARAAGFSERQLYRRPWLLVRGLVMARRAESQPELYTADRIDVVVHGGTRFTQLTYRLLKKHPEAEYHSGVFTARHVARWWAEALKKSDKVEGADTGESVTDPGVGVDVGAAAGAPVKAGPQPPVDAADAAAPAAPASVLTTDASDAVSAAPGRPADDSTRSGGTA